MIKENKYIKHGIVVAATIIIAATATSGIKPIITRCNQPKSFNMQVAGGELSSLKNADAWINPPPLTSTDLKGKVVLIQFGTYTCINWIRTLPYIRAWKEKYSDHGLIVVGVHTPEFAFEKNIDNVRRAMTDMKIDLPIAIDNNYSIWNAFNNQYWPAIYLIDAKGRVAHRQFGEGGYEETEKMMQQLLADAGAKVINSAIIPVNGKGIETSADWGNLGSQENYLGIARTEGFLSHHSGEATGKQYAYKLPLKLQLNQWGISGDWTTDKNSIISNSSNGKIIYRFHARDLHLVMGPVVTGTKVRFRVLIDDKVPGPDHGKDIDEQGYGFADNQRLYQLIRQSGVISDHSFTIEFLDPGAEAFSFTFG